MNTGPSTNTVATGRGLGALKTAAKRLGLSLDEYQARRDRGEKHCRICRQWLSVSAFLGDRHRGDGLSSMCCHCRNIVARARYTPIPPIERRPMGPPPKPAVDGAKSQARHRVNVLVRTGRLPKPNDLPCADCGHIYSVGEQRHEYDHHLGYAAINHLSVQIVCVPCHRRREKDRSKYKRRATQFPEVV